MPLLGVRRQDGGDDEKENEHNDDDDDDRMDTAGDAHGDALLASEETPVALKEDKKPEPLVCGPCEDSRVPNKLNSPIKPSAEAVEEHYLTHRPIAIGVPFA